MVHDLTPHQQIHGPHPVQGPPSEPEVPQVKDEIQEYISGRWVGASEAMWRIFEFDLHEMGPHVIRLEVHEEDKHTIVYKEFSDLKDVNLYRDTTLTAWFELNAKDPAARHLLYHKIPEHYLWNKTMQ